MAFHDPGTPGSAIPNSNRVVGTRREVQFDIVFELQIVAIKNIRRGSIKFELGGHGQETALGEEAVLG